MASNRGKKTRHDGVFKKENGNWFIQVVIREGAGFRSVERTLPADTPEAQVVAARARLRVELEAARATGTESAPTVPTIREVQAAARPTTVADYCEQWLKRKKSDWRPKTLHDNVEILSERILPVIGHVPVSELRRAHIMDWRSWAEGQRLASGKPYAGATLALWWRVLRGLLGDLVVDHELSTSLIFKVKAPRSDKPRVKAEGALTVEELGKLLKVLREKHNSWYAEVYTMAYSGMRPGELYALTWGDVDLPGGRIVVSKSVVQGKVGKPKNGKCRIIALTDGMKAVLEAHRSCCPGLPGALVFASDSGGFRSDTSLHHLLASCGKEAGIDLKLGAQVLRYTANTLLREAGVADEIVRDRLGHTTREMGHRYYKGHIAAQKAAVETLAAAVEGGVRGSR